MTDPTSIKVGGMVGGVAATAPALILGINPATLSAAIVGALLSLAYSRPETWGSTLKVPAGPPSVRYPMIIAKAGGVALSMAASAMVGSWLVHTLPHMPGLQGAASIPEAPLAGLLAFAGQNLIPRVLASANRFVESKGGK